MLKQISLLLIAMFLFTGCNTFGSKAQVTQEQAKIAQTVSKVCKWMLDNRTETAGGKRHDTNWTVGAWYSGVYAAYDLTKNPEFLKPLMAMETTTQWKVGRSPLFADDQCIAQTYLDLYMNVKKDPAMIANTQKVLDSMMAKPVDGDMTHHMQVCYKGEWSWCDSLYMGPAVWSKLAQATGEQKYLDFMDKKWWKTYDFLFDKDESLYYRDAAYFNKREANGAKVFWSRGNGWVMGGLARVIESMPQDYPSRPRYIELYKEMAARIVSIQQEDGLWHSSLLDPASYPQKETSGSGFYCYALAWGVNNGILDKEQYLPAVDKAWNALLSCVTEEGKLTSVQPIGADPRKFDPDSTEVYGVGAFLLTGHEMYKLAEIR
ncbi:MAG: glycoside hydrolase family 88 protein [Phycisphaerae bacterium]|nr:glycoside hydrolase family 88 protein [Phycisphaerae bacterium]